MFKIANNDFLKFSYCDTSVLYNRNESFTLGSKDDKHFSNTFAKIKQLAVKSPSRVAFHEFDHLFSPSSSQRSSLFWTAENNRNKNRYPDILPYEHNRVILSKNQYINASPITISSKQFISCQAPLPNTFNEFWSMIYEYKTPIIVMLTNLLENKKIKAHCYWPSQVGQTEVFADISVTLDSVEVNENITKRYISVQHQGESEILQVLHMQFTSWPDFGVPHAEDLLKVVDEVEDRSKNYPNAPIVVHCSAGVGRSGTFIAIVAFDELKLNGETACVQTIVNELRQQRIGMVQTVEQYDFIKQITQQRS